LKPPLHNWLAVIRQIFQGFARALQDQSTGVLEFELKELENIFGLLVMGPLIGIQSPVFGVSVRIAPFMAKELKIMMSRSRGSDDPLGDLLSILNLG
jgi:hypothetical protein